MKDLDLRFCKYFSVFYIKMLFTSENVVKQYCIFTVNMNTS